MRQTNLQRSNRRRALWRGVLLLVAMPLTGCQDPAGPASSRIGPTVPQSIDVDAEAQALGAAPRGKGRIVFVRDDDVFIMNANGQAATQLTTTLTNLSPVLSPDGTQIAFVRSSNGIADIFVMNTDGSGVTPLTQNAGVNTSPSWSPDGTRIAFASTRDGDAEIYVMNANGTGVTQLTANSVYDGEPAWSPAGALIAWATEQISAGNREIFVMNANGSNPVRLTTNFLWDQKPAWSPDGTRIAYNCDRVVSQNPFATSAEVCVMNADGTGVFAVTDATGAFDAQPSWSPDGTKIVFTSDRDGDYDLYTVRADGGRASALTRNAANDGYPSWGR